MIHNTMTLGSKRVQIIDAVPFQTENLTYNGTEQSPTWNYYDPNTLTIGGVTSGTNAGTYEATFTPQDGYQWSDGTTTAQSATWTIDNRVQIQENAESASVAIVGVEDAVCELDTSTNERMTAVEDALCELDKIINGGGED